MQDNKLNYHQIEHHRNIINLKYVIKKSEAMAKILGIALGLIVIAIGLSIDPTESLLRTCLMSIGGIISSFFIINIGVSFCKKCFSVSDTSENSLDNLLPVNDNKSSLGLTVPNNSFNLYPNAPPIEKFHEIQLMDDKRQDMVKEKKSKCSCAFELSTVENNKYVPPEIEFQARAI